MCQRTVCPGTLKEPSGVAVGEASGDVYVVDKAAGLVTEFGEKGEVLSSFGNNGVGGAANGQLAGPSASGSGDLTEGSTVIESLAVTAGAFTAGEEISSAGIPAGTVVVSAPGGGVLEISEAVEAGKSGLSVPLTAAQRFAGPDAIAVDNTCSLHNQASEEACATDPSVGDVYVLDAGHQVIDKFSAAGVYVGQVTGLSEPRGVGVDAHGELWVGQQQAVASFNDAEVNEPLSSVEVHLAGTFNAQGFAVDGQDDLYLNSESGTVFKVGPNGCEANGCGGRGFVPSNELLNEAFDPHSSEWLGVELSNDDVYVDHGAALDRRAPDGSLVEALGAEPGPGQLTGGTGVAIDSASEHVYVAEAATGKVFSYGREPAGTPVVQNEAASKVTGDSAVLEGELDPRSEPGEAPSEYSYQYGRCATPSTCATSPFETTVPGGTVAPDFSEHTLKPAPIAGLSPSSTYHYRVIATNAHGHTEGERDAGGEEVIHTFTTQNAGTLVLPDRREWELVSPIDKRGAPIEPLGKEVSIQASADGDGMAFGTGSPTEADPHGSPATVQVLSLRGSDGWSSRDLTLPHESATRAPIGSGSEFRVFSGDLARVAVQPQGAFIPCASAEGEAQPCLSPQGTEQTAFLSDVASALYTPLVTAANDTAEPFAPFGEASKCGGPEPAQVICGPQFIDATPDLAHVVLDSHTTLTSPAGGNLYVASPADPRAAQVAPVSVLPPGEGGGPTGGFLGYHGENIRHAISDDGSRVFWSTGNATEPGPLYVRETTTAQTLRIGEGDVEYQDASSDGSRVLYAQGGELDECVISEAAGKLACTTTELGSGIIGTIPGAGEDAARVYFVSSAALAGGALAGEPNLYVRHAGVTRLVAVLSKDDFPDWAGAGDLTRLASRVSPDGRWLAFTSDRSLSGYDNRDAASGIRDQEVYLYDAETQRLTCASCDPTGARPLGEPASEASTSHGGIDAGEVWDASPSSWLAANLPGWNPYRVAHAVHQPRYVSDSGRLFFNSRDPLVSQASNENWNVYEFEPEDEGPPEAQCGPGAAGAGEVFEPERSVQVAGRSVTSTAGCLALISGGNRPARGVPGRLRRRLGRVLHECRDARQS